MNKITQRLIGAQIVAVVLFIMTSPALALEIGGNVTNSTNVSTKNQSSISTTVHVSASSGGKNATATSSTYITTSTSTGTTTAGVKLTMTQLQGKIGTLKRLTDTERSVLSANLKADANMRLLGPEIAILATIQRIDDVTGSFENLRSKLVDRVAASATASSSMNANVQTALEDMNTKILDAKMQITAAQNLSLGLKPDQGNKTTQQTNLSALKEAHAKVNAAIKDLIDARKDAAEITAAF